jgi:hypothetical protein
MRAGVRLARTGPRRAGRCVQVAPCAPGSPGAWLRSAARLSEASNVRFTPLGYRGARRVRRVLRDRAPARARQPRTGVATGALQPRKLARRAPRAAQPRRRPPPPARTRARRLPRPSLAARRQCGAPEPCGGSSDPSWMEGAPPGARRLARRAAPRPARAPRRRRAGPRGDGDVRVPKARAPFRTPGPLKAVFRCTRSFGDSHFLRRRAPCGDRPPARRALCAGRRPRLDGDVRRPEARAPFRASVSLKALRRRTRSFARGDGDVRRPEARAPLRAPGPLKALLIYLRSLGNSQKCAAACTSGGPAPGVQGISCSPHASAGGRTASWAARRPLPGP